MKPPVPMKARLKGKMETEFEWFLGVDWGGSQHAVALVNANGKVVHESTVAHEVEALRKTIDRVIELSGGKGDRIAVAIEVPHGPVVETLLDRGLKVFAINPRQLDRFRDRYSMSGAKDDRRDAQVLAESLRTDRRAYDPVRPRTAFLVAMREESRLYDELGEELHQAINRLRQQLERYLPNVLRFGEPNHPWIWRLIERVGTSPQHSRVRRSDIEKLLHAHRIRRVNTDEVLERLRAPTFPLADGVAEAARQRALVLIEQLRLLHRQRHACDERLRTLLGKRVDEEGPESGQTPPPPMHRDVEILRSMPGVGIHVCATMLGEAGTALRERDRSTIRTVGGQAPVTIQSGKSRRVLRRTGCNPRLRNALFHWGCAAVRCDPRSQSHYERLRDRGASHGRAIRGVVDRLIDVLIAMLRTDTLYDCDRRSPSELAA